MSWLEVHVFGARPMGEGIIVKFPDGKYAVIDCCYRGDSDEPLKNPMVSFLNDRKVRNLAFVCLSHPHEDHFHGLRQIVLHSPPYVFVRSAAMTPVVLRQIVKAEMLKARQVEDESRQRSIRELMDLEKALKDQDIILESALIATKIYPRVISNTNSFTVWAISPCGEEINTYQSSLAKCFDATGRAKEKLPTLLHNMISLAVLIQTRKFSIILGGDVETPNWEAALARFEAGELAARLVKVSHHGSMNGKCDGLWEAFSAGTNKPIAVVTGWRTTLPDVQLLNHIQPFADSIYCTHIDSLPMAKRPHTNQARSKSISAIQNYLNPDRRATYLESEFNRVSKIQPKTIYGRCSFFFSKEGVVERQEIPPPACECV